jgi:hypothetical protein
MLTQTRSPTVYKSFVPTRPKITMTGGAQGGGAQVVGRAHNPDVVRYGASRAGQIKAKKQAASDAEVMIKKLNHNVQATFDHEALMPKLHATPVPHR